MTLIWPSSSCRRRTVPAVLEECGRAGVKTGYIITSGFGEAPEGVGRELDAALREVCGRWPMAVGGPNGEGFYDVAADFAVTFSPTLDYERGLVDRPVPGHIAVVAQSGGVGFGIFNQGTARGLRFSKVISTGNEVDLEALDYVEYLLEDEATQVIALFIEGFKAPDRIREIGARALEVGKPIVVAKIGRSVEAQRTAVSHTGHLTGRSDLYSALFRHTGMIEVRDLPELLDVLAALSTSPRPSGRRMGVFTASGGAGAWLVDACADHGVEVPELDAEEQRRILAGLPYFASTTNPVDYTAAAGNEDGIRSALRVLSNSSAIDVVVLVSSLLVAASLRTRIAPLIEIVAEAGKPLLVHSYTEPAPESIRVMAELGVPWFTDQDGLARTVALLADCSAEAQFRSEAPMASPAVGWSAIGAPGAAATRTVPEYEVKGWLRRAGLPVPLGHLVQSEAAAVRAAADLGYPVVVKLQSATVAHKSDVGAVIVGIESRDRSPRRLSGRHRPRRAHRRERGARGAD